MDRLIINKKISTQRRTSPHAFKTEVLIPGIACTSHISSRLHLLDRPSTAEHLVIKYETQRYNTFHGTALICGVVRPHLQLHIFRRQEAVPRKANGHRLKKNFLAMLKFRIPPLHGSPQTAEKSL